MLKVTAAAAGGTSVTLAAKRERLWSSFGVFSFSFFLSLHFNLRPLAVSREDQIIWHYSVFVFSVIVDFGFCGVFFGLLVWKSLFYLGSYTKSFSSVFNGKHMEDATKRPDQKI